MFYVRVVAEYRKWKGILKYLLLHYFLFDLYRVYAIPVVAQPWTDIAHYPKGPKLLLA